ncbi:SHOCT domain-containing protein [Virgibacillus sp. FSP13]
MCNWMFGGTFGGDMFSGMGFPMMALGGITILLFWGLVIWAVIYLIRKLTQGQTFSTDGHTLKILQERYARGEIDTQEYNDKYKELNKGK